jgi:shikimate kinase
MANYLGAALSIELHAKAHAKAIDGSGIIIAKVPDHSCEDTSLIEASARTVLERYGLSEKRDLYVEVRSEIPVARGLKSSSAIANAVVLACCYALNRRASARECLKMGVRASFRAGVTLTGAFDDACASMLGGGVVTDNKRLLLLKRFRANARLRAVLLVPPVPSFSGSVDVKRVKPMGEVLALAHSLALNGRPWLAMTVNGLACSDIFGNGGEAALAALRAGSLGAGLSGKGPAVAAIALEDEVPPVREALGAFEGEVMTVRVNNERAKVGRTAHNH